MKDWIWILLMLAAVAFVLLASWHVNIKKQTDPRPVHQETSVRYVEVIP